MATFKQPDAGKQKNTAPIPSNVEWNVKNMCVVLRVFYSKYFQFADREGLRYGSQYSL